MARVTFLDLFSGAGLFSQGFVAAGFRCAGAVELDAFAVESYRRNVGPEIVRGSVQDHAPSGQADVVIAGPPCQGFSTLGRRDPTDERNALCLEVARWAGLAEAKVVVVENVPPFLASPRWEAMAASLRQAGMTIETWELDAADFGVPQRRRRSFTVASRVGQIGAPPPSEPGGHAGKVFEGLDEAVAARDPMHRWPVPSVLAAARIALVPEGGDKRDILRAAPHLCPPSWERVGGNATDVYGRMDPRAPANTIRCTFQNPSKGRYLHPTENRVISLREGARLQGIPDSWTLAGGHYPVSRQIGNGVPVPLAEAVAKRIRQALR